MTAVGATGADLAELGLGQLAVIANTFHAEVEAAGLSMLVAA